MSIREPPEISRYLTARAALVPPPRVELTWETGNDDPCPWVIGDTRPGASDYESAHSALAPPMDTVTPRSTRPVATRER